MNISESKEGCFETAFKFQESYDTLRSMDIVRETEDFKPGAGVAVRDLWGREFVQTKGNGRIRLLLYKKKVPV